jgi:hypothetical protein
MIRGVTLPRFEVAGRYVVSVWMVSKAKRQVIHTLLFLYTYAAPTVIRPVNEINSSRVCVLPRANISSTVDGVFWLSII